MQPRDHPLHHSQHLETSKGAVTIRRIPPWPLLPWPQPCEGSHQDSSPSLPKSFALCLRSGVHTAFCKGNHLEFFFFIKDFPIPFRSSPAPIELREMGLLICRHELIAHELWQLFQKGVSKVISAINPLWAEWFFWFFFTLLILQVESCTDLQVVLYVPMGFMY